MADSRDITGKNRKFTGTGGIKVPSGTEAQRVDEAGTFRFNTDTNLAEYYDGTDWKPIDAPPTITGFSIDGGAVGTSGEVTQLSGDTTIVIQGSNFDITSGTVVFEPEAGGSNVSVQTITRTSSSSFTVTATRTDFNTANDPYAIKLTNGSGLAATLASAIVVNDTPVFTTAADTTVASKYEGQSAPFSETTLAATDPEGDAITYSISAGSLPPGITINSSTAALEGTISGSSIQDYTFTVQAATAKGNSTRQFVFEVVASPFINATGGTETTSGDYKIHTFTSPGNFVVSSAGTPAGSTQVDYLVVAGGGGGGSGHGGGAGAGGFRESHSTPVSGPYTASPLATPTGITVSATTYPVVVSAGGTAAPYGGSGQTPGPSSSFATITSSGGGFGGAFDNPSLPGGSGGSGGGGGNGAGTGTGSGGSGNSPPVSPPQGSNGASQGPNGGPWAAAGGGGATGGGNPAGSNSSGGPGGPGATTSISGSPTAYSGGGGGNGGDGGSVGVGGTGGGGPGNLGGQGTAPSGTANTGGGGGGARDGQGGNGGSGIVIIRYKYQ